jgi:hypothetical protein
MTDSLNKDCYIFLFDDRMIETLPKKYHGKPIKDMNEAFGILKNITSINDLEKWEFSLEREYIFDTESTVEFKQESKIDDQMKDKKEPSKKESIRFSSSITFFKFAYEGYS